ncbi:pentatricopeptide repeat-containing protein [Tanacetum coccineum]
MVDNTLFTKKKSSNLIIVQIYVDDIIFGSTCQEMCDEFAKIMHDEFEMSMMGELNFFLGLQIKQMEDGIFFNQSKYIKEMLKKFGLEDSKPMKTPMSSDTKLTKDEECESVDSTKYRGMIGTCGETSTVKFRNLMTVEEFAQILDIPCEGACVFTDKWSLEDLAYSVLRDGPYQTNPPSPDDIIPYIRNNQEGQVTRIRHKKKIDVQDHQILTREIVSTLKPLEEIIRENVFCLGGNRDHVPTCLCYMLYCIARSEKFNLTYYMAKQMEWVTQQARLILPCERKTKKDCGTRRGRHSTSSSSAFDQPSSYHIKDDDDDDGNDEGISHASTPSPTRFVNSLTNEVPQVFQNPSNIDPDMEQFYTR